MAYKEPKMIKQGTAAKRKQVSITVPQKLEVIRRIECGEMQREVMAPYNFGSSSIYDVKKQKD
jgi:hypothetical protein